jgi:subtilisin family serine protease
MKSWDLVGLTALGERTSGAAATAIGLVDGPVAVGHPDLSGADLHEIPGVPQGSCATASSAACLHGTFVAGMFAAGRNSAAAGICPGCPVLIRPIFHELGAGDPHTPSATASELAAAIVQTVDAGARVINVSAALVRSSDREDGLHAALDHAAARGAIVVAAAGNQGTVGSVTGITRHPWVIPVAACDLRGRPLDHANLGTSISRRGLRAPGEDIVGLAAGGGLRTLTGSSASAPFVTGTIALLWSEFPAARPEEIRAAVLQRPLTARRAIVPPLLDAWAAYLSLARLAVRSG